MAAKENPSELIRAKDLAAFDRWALPSFDEGDVSTLLPSGGTAEEPVDAESSRLAEPVAQGKDVPLEEVKPLTLEELEAIRQEVYQEAYNEGFSVGERDGLHAGQVKARQEAEVQLQAKVQRLEQLMEHLFEPIAQQDQQLEQALLDVLIRVSREVIQRELHSDSSQLRQVLQGALKLLPMGAGNITLYVNPQDFELVKALRERHAEQWRIFEDDSLLPGGCRIETEHSRIDATIETRLNEAIKQLYEQQRLQAAHVPPADIQLDLETGDAP